MLNKSAKLHKNTLNVDKLDIVPTRNGFGDGLVELGDKNPDVLALCADLTESTRMQAFRDKYPERYVELGVAEQNLATVAAGMAAMGKVPFIASYAAFSPGRNNEQIRTTISLNESNVKVVGSHAGVSVGPDGATHQALEDIGLMRMQPNMTVVVPADAEEARKATIAIGETDKPAYIRLGRSKTPLFTTKDTPFEIGKAEVFYDAEEPVAGIIGAGPVLHNAILAAEEMTEVGVPTSVLNLHTVKPLDKRAVVEFAQKCGAIVTVEEHQIAGGIGSAVAECLAAWCPVPVEFIGVHDQFGQSGNPDELIAHYKMDKDSIKDAIEKVFKRK
jgi:transketolase